MDSRNTHFQLKISDLEKQQLKSLRVTHITPEGSKTMSLEEFTESLAPLAMPSSEEELFIADSVRPRFTFTRKSNDHKKLYNGTINKD